MFNQHAKWLESTSEIAWRRPIASLNYLLTSHVWRQDHNGLSHQDPGFVDHVANKKAEIMQVYLPDRSVARGVEEGSKQMLRFDGQANMCHPRESGDPAVGTRRSGNEPGGPSDAAQCGKPHGAVVFWMLAFASMTHVRKARPVLGRRRPPGLPRVDFIC